MLSAVLIDLYSSCRSMASTWRRGTAYMKLIPNSSAEENHGIFQPIELTYYITPQGWSLPGWPSPPHSSSTQWCATRLNSPKQPEHYQLLEDFLQFQSCMSPLPHTDHMPLPGTTSWPAAGHHSVEQHNPRGLVGLADTVFWDEV